MPNAYDQLSSLLTTYLDEDKVQKVLERQLERCDTTPESFSQAQLKDVVPYVIGAAVIYVTDDVQREALRAKIKAFA